MSLSKMHCPQSFCGFSFEDVQEWLGESPAYTPIVCHNNIILLQFPGWCINLYCDGSYAVEVTEGG
jgi:hypothetical protein